MELSHIPVPTQSLKRGVETDKCIPRLSPCTALSEPLTYIGAHHPGALTLFRLASYVLIIVYIIGGIIEYMYNETGANVGDTPAGYVCTWQGP